MNRDEEPEEELSKDERLEGATMQNRYRPGPGWRQVASRNPSVWEHSSGVRLNLSGLIRFPGGDYLYTNSMVYGRAAARFIRINGGNRKRGLMAYAVSLF